MKTGLVIFNSRTHGYFSKHWKDELVSRGFDFYYADPNNREKNFQHVRSLLGNNRYQYLLITAGTIPLEFSQVKYFNDITKILFLTDDDWQFYPFSRFYGLAFDWIITTYRDNIALYRKHGFDNVILSQWGFNQSLFRPLNMPKDIEVSLIGGPHGDRIEMLQYLMKSGIRIHLYGPGWNKLSEFKKQWQGHISDDKMIEVINRTKINLNPSRAGDRSTLQVKGRTFELAGCRGFQLTERNNQLFDFFEQDKEIVTYESYGDLKEKVVHFLKHEDEREAIASAAYQRALREHTWKKRLGHIFSELEKRMKPGSLPYQLSAQKPKVNVIYIARGSRTLCPKTLTSVQNQDYDNFTVYLNSCLDISDLADHRFVRFGDSMEALRQLNGEYVAFVSDGDVWTPEKLSLQVFALENEPDSATAVIVSNFGLYFHEPENEIIYYNFTNARRDNGVADQSQCIVLSTVAVNADIVRRYHSEFARFIDVGIMPGTLQKEIISKKEPLRYIDMQYSLCKMPFKSFNASLKAHYRPGSETTSFSNFWNWRSSRNKIMKKTLLSRHAIDAIVAFMISLALKKSIPLHRFLKPMPVS